MSIESWRGFFLAANNMTVVTKEVVETARENLIIGPN
jgi:hypothetical protein